MAQSINNEATNDDAAANHTSEAGASAPLSPVSRPDPSEPHEPVAATGNDYDEEEDDDYDPEAKAADDEVSDDSDKEDPGEKYDYSAISATATQVRTRNQRYQEKHEAASRITNIIGPVSSNLDFDSIFSDLKSKSVEGKPTNWNEILGSQDEDTTNKDAPTAHQSLVPAAASGPATSSTTIDDQDKIWIKTSYVFAGKVITESKQVDANSAEAKAFLGSSAGLQINSSDEPQNRAFVPVIRTIPGEKEPVELRIKLKRPSLIDRFMSTQGNKHQKLSTLEKSRLDWACFVDQNKINDELKLHNKDGYLEKQDFLGRLQAKQDESYSQAKEVDRARRWQEQQKAL
ncbi:swr complex subunit [Yamadazyma tenuis]|uniref:SWR1-complex protein 5 n=1 Tax=Candida tenuis (strain ATCC 10573 / BCRC 21748 / CBS 615 / JCM 9827 / NBRC 10315 / NRRL Y-1498 / VKM Y-70) TaxID=590646 RepID=G3B553_CANTC|nr:uncharacterized protein CANTEDRAFT_122964 [Yamadazyma tenuis ATCC 10573]EGV63140.1 hypothetical protein CANTEDRAFT_122964 [Yamadazyma tenuis ATCC 10573]WEJ97043.1 swr complex subunit [Yamadazyma tenuis]